MPQDAVDRDDERRMPAEVQYAFIVVAILMVIAFAGVPGRREPTAGDGTSKLRHGWAAQRAAAARSSEPGGTSVLPAAQSSASPSPAGLDPSEPRR